MASRVLRDTTDSIKVNYLSPAAEVFLYRLFMKADDHGRFHANPGILRGNLFPLRLDSVTEKNIIDWICECEKAGLVITYEHESKRFIEVLNFGQRLRNMRQKFPPPSIVSESRANVSNPPPETIPKRNDLETDSEVDLEGKKKFAINGEWFSCSFREWFEKYRSIFLPSFEMNNGRDTSDAIFKRMEDEYLAYTFRDQNHIQRTFLSILKKIISEQNGQSDRNNRKASVTALRNKSESFLSGNQSDNDPGSG